MHPEAGAALLFLILYTMLMCWMLFMFHTRRYLWSSRWVVLLLHSMIRVVASGLMIGFAYKGWRNRDLALAAQIMSAEGYFGIAIACYYCLRHFDHVHFGKSVLGYRGSSPEWRGRNGLRRLGEVLALIPLFLPWRYLREQLSIIESWLLVANVIIVVGAALLGVATANPIALLLPNFKYKLGLVKGLRGAGQSLLLLFSVMLCGYVARAAYKMSKKRSWAHRQKRGMAGVTLALYGVVGLLMIPRSCWGIIQAVVWKYMLVNPANFTLRGTQPRFLAIDYCLSTVPEMLSSIALNASWWTWHAERAPHSPGVPSDEISFADGHSNDGANGHGHGNGNFHPDYSVAHTEKAAQPGQSNGMAGRT